jgi:hypothetical protein
LNLSNTHSISEGSVTMFLREGGWGRIKGYGRPQEHPELIRLSANSCFLLRRPWSKPLNL